MRLLRLLPLAGGRGALRFAVMAAAVIAVSAIASPSWAQRDTHALAGPVPPDTVVKGSPTTETVDIVHGAHGLEIDSMRTVSPAESDSAAMTAAAKPSPVSSGVMSDTVTDSLDVLSNTVAGIGAGLSLGSNPVFRLWQNGLPQTLADFGLKPDFMAAPGDTLSLSLTVKEKPDMYNFTIPVALSFSRLMPERRYGGSVAFSWLSKEYTSSVSIGADSLRRRIDIGQRLRLYSLAVDFLYGRTIPKRYFSIDGVGRTDICIGISAVPFVSFKKTTSIAGPEADPRLSAVKDSLTARINAFSSSGIAWGGRTGIFTERSLSKSSGLEVGFCYSVLRCARFSAGGAPLTENAVSVQGIASKKISYFSHRFEITFTLVRSLHGTFGPQKAQTMTPAATPEP